MKRADTIEAAVRLLDVRDIYPSAGSIQRLIGERVTHNLNGRDCRVRERVLVSLGYEHTWSANHGAYLGRWVKDNGEYERFIRLTRPVCDDLLPRR